jgi:hypothetical protein
MHYVCTIVRKYVFAIFLLPTDGLEYHVQS